ncbi:hypothetical protein PSI19_19965 [Xenorhabdus khoisanae]|uniref:hypothetical protein n=1 Tax=Xenorhabdus khoisanae TaxID=880157 RepID=UPI0023594D31|nr:hypothetical protein [Xenorhabdus khoisanae]MDC9616088.1 hypothetical protein [Xenorhabdus khoisanae]
MLKIALRRFKLYIDVYEEYSIAENAECDPFVGAEYGRLGYRRPGWCKKGWVAETLSA